MIGVGGASCGVNNSIQTARRHPEVKSLALLSGSTDLKGRQFLRESTKLPVFFAVADDDEFPLSIVAIEWLYSLAADPDKKFVHAATGGHGADMFKVHPDMPGEIVNWYVTTLIKTPGRAPGSKEMATVSEEVHVLDELDQPGGVTKVAKKLEEARQRDPNAKLFREDFVNVMGYEHLQASDNKGAIEILRLNVQAYPNSPNVYDSLSDAYFAEGQRDLARDNAKKALQLLASDTTDPEDRRNAIKASAEQKLKQLGEAP
jgi:tetratricopeptide (TPR) repeat protein